MKRTFWLIGLVAFASWSAPARAQHVTVNPSERHQTIEGWGACMIFWSLSQTPYEDPAWRAAYRDLGLNILRMDMKKNVLVDASGDMSVPVVLGADLADNIALMDFDNSLTKVYGDMAVWLSQNALEPARVKIVGSIWSPPHWMKGPTGATQYHVSNPSVSHPTPWLSGGTSGDSIGGRLLQTADNLEQFARYLAAWVEGFEDRYGVPVYAISLQNEITFENPFDSCTYESGPNGEGEQWWQYADALEAVRTELQSLGLTVKIKGPHMANLGASPDNPWALWRQMGFIQAVKDHANASLIDRLDFYNSNGYMGTDEDSVKSWAGYYHGSAAVPGAWAAWADVPGVGQDGKPIWVSEVGGAQAAWLNGGGGTPGTGAITVAQKMHNAIVHANASAYVYWQMSDTGDAESEHTLLGKSHVSDPHASKKYAAFKHFSRYVRPGAQRVTAVFDNGQTSLGGASEYDTYNSLVVSAFVHEQDQTATIVLLNMTGSAESVTVDVPWPDRITSYEVYRTSESEGFAEQADLEVTGDQVSLSVPAYSAVTLHGVNPDGPLPDAGPTDADGGASSPDGGPSSSDGGPSVNDPGEGSCGCRADASAPGGLPLFLLLLGCRRRRQRCR